MALSTFIGSFNLNTSTGNQSITGVGFQPKVVLFLSAVKEDAQGNRDNMSLLVGAATSSSAQFSHGDTSFNWGSASSNTTQSAQTNACISVWRPGDGGLSTADFVSQDSDGFTIHISAAPGTSFRIFYIALGGSDLTAKVGTVTAPAGTGSQAFTGFGFKPDAMMFSFWDGAGTGTGGIWQSYFGFAKSSSQRGVNMTCERNARVYLTDTQANNQQLTNACLGGVVGGANDSLADLVSMDSDGFTANWSNAGGSYTVAYIALKGANFKIGSFSENTSTGNQSITGVGFQPSLVLAISQHKASTSAIQTSYMGYMFGMAMSSSNRRVFAGQVSNGTALGQGQIRTSEALFLTHITGTSTTATPTVNAESDFVSMDFDGFTFNMTTADATSREVLYFAIGAAPTSTASIAWLKAA